MPEERPSRLLSLAPQFGSFAVIIALAAALIPATKKTSTPAPESTSAAPTGAEAPAPQDRFNTFLLESRLTDGKEGTPLKDSFDGHAMIATLPDPTGTDFGYWFDQCVESIGRAMADAA